MVRRVNDDLMHAIAAAKGGATDGTDGTVMRLADDQFQVLVDLLTPGYELALLYKAQATGNAHPDEPTPPAATGETIPSMDPGPAIGSAHADPAKFDGFTPATQDPSAQGSG